MALINMTKKIDKARGTLGIGADETILAACTTNTVGMMKRTLAVGLGGAVGGAIAARGTGESLDGAEGLAARFASGQYVLALTDQRLLQVKLSALTGKPKEIVAQWPRSQVVRISVEETKLAHPMEITFADGTTVQAEGAKGTDPKALAL